MEDNSLHGVYISNCIDVILFYVTCLNLLSCLKGVRTSPVCLLKLTSERTSYTLTSTAWW